MLESRVENYLKKRVENLGGKAYKWAPVGVVGVPDRMVLLPGGKIIFVELKAPGKKARKLQEHRAKQLRELGFQVECLDTIEKIDRLLQIKCWCCNNTNVIKGQTCKNCGEIV